MMETAAQAHLEKRVFLEKLLALGERGPLAALTTRASGAPFLKLNWGTHAISLVGLNELCRAVLQSDLHDSEATMEFALKVLTHLKREAERLSNKHKVRFLLSGQSTEVTAHRLARLDLRFFGETAASVVCGDAASDVGVLHGRGEAFGHERRLGARPRSHRRSLSRVRLHQRDDRDLDGRINAAGR